LKGFVRELRRRRVFRTAGIYVVGAWLLLQVADVLFPGWGLPDATINILFIAAVLGFPLALVFGWFFDITTHGIVRTPGPDEQTAETPLALQRRDYLILAALAVIGVAILTQTTREVVEMPRVSGVTQLEISVIEEKLPNSIAVLPFANISDDPNNEFFCDGVSEEILNRLGGFRGLNVIGRTSSFKFKDSDYELPRISDLLGSRYLLQGSVRKQNERLRISAQLLDETGTQLWTESFDRTLGDIFAIQAEIAEIVASTIVPQITGPTTSRYEPSLEAYQYFLEGREMLRRRADIRGRAREQLQKAIELDPRYAEAHAELALTYLFGTTSLESIAVANEAIDTALRLEPDIPRALAIRALSLQQQNDPDWAVSEIVLRKVLAKEPNMVDALNWLAVALASQGKLVEAETTTKKAARLDPLHGAVAVNVARAAARRGDFDTAERSLLRLLETPQPAYATFTALRDFYRQTGRLVDLNAIGKRQVLTVRAHYYTLFLSYAILGLWDQAAYWSERNMIDVPDSFWTPFFPAYLPYFQGRYRTSLDEYDKALAEQGKTLAEMPQFFVLIYGDAQALAGDFEGAVRTLEPVIGPPRPVNFGEFQEFEREALHSLAWSYAQVGLPEKGRLLLETLERQIGEIQRLGLLHMSNPLFFYARNALFLGDHELALERFEKAVEAGWRDYYYQRHDPRWAPLADDPRYQALIAEVKANVDRQRAEVERIDAEEDFVANLDQAQALRPN
jgi:TolB-like protein/Tfp pilus assembly protein PilF